MNPSMLETLAEMLNGAARGDAPLVDQRVYGLERECQDDPDAAHRLADALDGYHPVESVRLAGDLLQLAALRLQKAPPEPDARRALATLIRETREELEHVAAATCADEVSQSILAHLRQQRERGMDRDPFWNISTHVGRPHEEFMPALEALMEAGSVHEIAPGFLALPKEAPEMADANGGGAADQYRGSCRCGGNVYDDGEIAYCSNSCTGGPHLQEDG